MQAAWTRARSFLLGLFCRICEAKQTTSCFLEQVFLRVNKSIHENTRTEKQLSLKLLYLFSCNFVDHVLGFSFWLCCAVYLWMILWTLSLFRETRPVNCLDRIDHSLQIKMLACPKLATITHLRSPLRIRKQLDDRCC